MSVRGLCSTCWVDYAHAEYALSSDDAHTAAWARDTVADFREIAGTRELNWPPAGAAETPPGPQRHPAAHSLTALIATTFPYRDPYVDTDWAHHALVIESPGAQAIEHLLTRGFRERALASGRSSPHPFGIVTVHDQRSLDFRLQEFDLPTPEAWTWWSTITSPRALTYDESAGSDPDCVICNRGTRNSRC